MTAGTPSPAHALGAGDCEAWRDGRLGQPTNAVTSAAYLVAAGWLLRRARNVDPAERWRVRTAATVAAATGVGSVAYHGIGGPVSHALHDGALWLLVAWMPVGVGRRPAPAGDAAVVTRRRTAGTAAAIGVVAYALGRTDAATCRPTSRWQWHGAWHVAGAVATAAWSDAVDVLPHVSTGAGSVR